MSQQVVPSAVVQHIIKFVSDTSVEPAELLMRLRAQFADEMLSKTQLFD
jgi:hypothetical protein